MIFFPALATNIQTLLSDFDQIGPARRDSLQQLADYIRQKQANKQSVYLNFICTHNSRRSHLAQIWAATAAAHYQLSNIYTYSGGTEATAFHPNAIAAIQRMGFQLSKAGESNPTYSILFSAEAPPLLCFSKTYDDDYNPIQHFAAIMTCSNADDNCPLIPGTELRLPLTYQDPKIADNTPLEAATYDERTHQIGRELFYAMSLI